MNKRTCPCCKRNRVGPIKQWTLNSAYTDKSLNVMTCCVHCILEDDMQFAYLWADYYNGTGVGGYSHYTDFLYNRRWPWRTL